MRQGLRLGLGLILAALVWVSPICAPLTQAQDSLRQVDETGALLPRQGPGLIAPAASSAEETVSLDYAAWERLAERAEKAAANRNVGSEALEAIRRQMVDWRSALLGEQNANAARIATLRAQIAALGHPRVRVSLRSRRSLSVARCWQNSLSPCRPPALQPKRPIAALTD